MPFMDLIRSIVLIELQNNILLILLYRPNSGRGEGREESKQTDRLYYLQCSSEMVVADLPE